MATKSQILKYANILRKSKIRDQYRLTNMKSLRNK